MHFLNDWLGTHPVNQSSIAMVPIIICDFHVVLLFQRRLKISLNGLAHSYSSIVKIWLLFNLRHLYLQFLLLFNRYECFPYGFIMLPIVFRITPISNNLGNELIFLIIDVSHCFKFFHHWIIGLGVYRHFGGYLLEKLGRPFLHLVAQIWKKCWLAKLMTRSKLLLNGYSSWGGHYLRLFFNWHKVDGRALRRGESFGVELVVFLVHAIKGACVVLALLSGVGVKGYTHVLDIFLCLFLKLNSHSFIRHFGNRK